MDGKGIKVRFEADESPIRSALTKVEKSVKTISKDLKEVDKLLELDPNNVSLLGVKQEQLATAVERTAKNLKAMEAANDDMTKGYQKWQQNQQAIEDNEKAIKKMTEQLEAAKASMKAMQDAGGKDIELTEEYAAAAHTVESLTKALSDLKKEQDKLKMADPNAIPVDVYQRYIRDTESLKINLRQLDQQQKEVNAAIADGGKSAAEAARAEEEAARAAEEQARAEADRKRAEEQAAEADRQAKKTAEEYKDALNKLESAANNVKNDIKGMVSVVTTGTAAIASAVAAGTVASTKVGMEFTKSMSKVEALSGATTSELEALRDAASEAGANTSKTASEAADALGYMALAGWDTNQMLGGLMPILRASEAGEMDLAKCSDAVTDSMSAMGIAVDDLQHYLDVCSKTQSSANTSLEQLLEAYVTCGGTLKNLNIPLEESATILGTLANRGIKGAEAGNALNSILVNLIGANRNAASAMKDMGISAFDADGRFIGLEETLRLVKAKLDEYGDDTEKITQLEARLGGKTQLDTLQALLSGVSEEYDDLNAKILDCNGALESTAKTMQDNLTGDITSLQSALEGVENTIFSSLEEPFRSAAQNVTQDLRTLNAACSEGELAEGIKKIATSISELISKISKFATDEAFPTLIKWLEWITDHSDLVISAIQGMGAAWAAWKIMQLGNDIKGLVDAIKLVKAAEEAATAAQTGLTVSTDVAKLSEEALAAAAEKAAMAHMLMVAAIGAVVIALGAFIAKKLDAAAEELKHKNQIDETTQAIYDQTAAYKEGLEEAEKNAEAADKNAEAAKHYWSEVQNLVDENGRATGSTEELKTAVARLNEVAGTNIEVVNGQIQGYQDLADTMDNLIEATRRQAKASYLQDSYGEALLNIEDVTAQYNQAWDDLNEATAEYEEKKRLYNAAKNTKFYTKDQLKELEAAADAAEERVAQATVKYNALSDSYQTYTSVIEDYEGLFTQETPAANTKSPDQIAAEAEAKRIEEENRKNAELIKLGVKKTWEDLDAELKDLDDKLALHAIDEGSYWEERRQLLEDSQYKENKDWWAYYEKVQDHYDKLAETEKKAQETASKEQQKTFEKSIDDQIKAVKERQELNDDFTKEMMYNEMETIISGLDKESDIYKKYNSEILKGRKSLADEGTKTIAAGMKSDVTEIENSIKTVVSDYQNNLKNLLSQRDSYFNKLFDTSAFTSRSKQTDKDGNEADVLTLSDPKEAFKKLVEYEKAYEELKAKNVSENVLAWIDSLDQATAKDTMDILNHMSDSELKSYSSSFDQYKDKATQMADSKYAAQIDELNTGFVKKVDDLLATLPGKAEVDGENTVAGFVQGLKNKGNDLSNAASDFANRFIAQVKKDLDINSPSGEGEDLGEYSGEGFIKGVEKSADGMDEAVDNFTNSFITKLAQKDPAIRAAMEDTFTGNLTAVLENMETLADASLNRIAASLSSKLPALPDITQLSLPSADAVRTAASGSSETTALIDRIDTIISLIQSISVSTGDGQTIKLQLEIGGTLEANMDSLIAVIVQKLNNLSIQTGKPVFSY